MQLPEGTERDALIVGAAQALVAVATIFYTAANSPSTADQLIVNGHAIVVAGSLTLYVFLSAWMSKMEIKRRWSMPATVVYLILGTTVTSALEPLVTSTHLHLQAHSMLAQALLVGTVFLTVVIDRRAAACRGDCALHA